MRTGYVIFHQLPDYLSLLDYLTNVLKAKYDFYCQSRIGRRRRIRSLPGIKCLGVSLSKIHFYDTIVIEIKSYVNYSILQNLGNMLLIIAIVKLILVSISWVRVLYKVFY